MLAAISYRVNNTKNFVGTTKLQIKNCKVVQILEIGKCETHKLYFTEQKFDTGILKLKVLDT